MLRGHIPKLKIMFPSEILVSSDKRPYIALVRFALANRAAPQIIPTVHSALRHAMYFKRAHRVETQQSIELMSLAVT